MDAVVSDSFGSLFNSPLETGIRAVLLLETIRPEMADLPEMVLFDHVVVHTADFGGPPSLHPDVSGRRGEILVRRRLVEKSLELMQRFHLVEQHVNDNGIFYKASEEAAAYIDLLETDYSVRLKTCARWLGTQISEHSKSTFMALVRERLGVWDDTFGLTIGREGRGE